MAQDQDLTEFNPAAQTNPAGTVQPITVDVFSDVICPWCYVGSRRLAEGIALFRADGGPAGPVPVPVRWHPFELNPEMPAAGADRREYRSAKFGSWARSQQLDAEVAAAGIEDGLQFRHELIQRTPNTRAAHRLVWLSQQHGRGQQMVDALFAGYFTHGLDAGNPTVLAELAAKVGLPAGEVTQSIAGTGIIGAQAEAGVAAAIAKGRELRISGVPFYVFGGAYTLPPGAQPAEVIAQVLRVVRQDQHTIQLSEAPVGAAAGSPQTSNTDVNSCDLDGNCA